MSSLGFQGRAIISLPVSNLERSRRWYADMLGLQLERRLGEPPWCELKTPVPNLFLGLAEVDPVRVGDAVLTLAVRDVQAARRQLLEKGAEVSEAVHVPGVARMVTLMDPDGNAVMLRECVDGVLRTGQALRKADGGAAAATGMATAST